MQCLTSSVGCLFFSLHLVGYYITQQELLWCLDINWMVNVILPNTPHTNEPFLISYEHIGERLGVWQDAETKLNAKLKCDN